MMKTVYLALMLLILMLLPISVYAHGEGEESAFTDSIVISIDGEEYTLENMTEDAQGLPGHEWLKISETEYFALHHNVGPNEAESWWATEAPNDELLYVVNVVIDTWTIEKAEAYAERGYVHYQPLIHVTDGTRHPEMIAWMQHIALDSFHLDGGSQPLLGHDVVPGIDRLFLPNWSTEYNG